MTPGRAWHAIVAMLALIGLAIEYRVTLVGHPGELARRSLIYLSFFTILTNGIVMAASAGFAAGAGRASNASLRTAIAVQITVVAVIFQLLLAGLIPLSPLGWWGNMLVHQLVPALWLIGWIAFGPHGGIRATAPLRWLAYPALYTLWVLAHGWATGWYPYPFIDVRQYGWPATLPKLAAIAFLFAVLGYAFRWIDGRLAWWRAPARRVT